MAKPKAEPRIVRPDDIDPHHNWKRPIGAPATPRSISSGSISGACDYRLARVRAALSQSACAASSISTTSAIRRAQRSAVGARQADALFAAQQRRPTSGISAARPPPRLYALAHVDHCKAGLLARGATGGDIIHDAAKEIKAILDAEASATCSAWMSSRQCCSNCRSSGSRCATASGDAGTR